MFSYFREQDYEKRCLFFSIMYIYTFVRVKNDSFWLAFTAPRSGGLTI